MRDPERWLVDPSGAPEGVVELLRAAERPAPPPIEVRGRLGAHLARLGATVPPRGPLWLFGAGAMVAALGVGGWLGLSRLRTPPPAIPHAPLSAPAPAARAGLPPLPLPLPSMASAQAGPPAAEGPAPADVPAPAHPLVPPPSPPHAAAPRRSPGRGGAVDAHRGAARPAPAAAPSSEDSLAREAALIEASRRTVRAHPAAALVTLEQHRREFPAGQLTAEREFLTVHALVQLGRRAEAEARGRQLVQQYPRSAYAQQVPALLGSAPSTTGTQSR